MDNRAENRRRDFMERKKMLPIGMEFFADIRTRGYYYVDKSLRKESKVVQTKKQL